MQKTAVLVALLFVGGGGGDALVRGFQDEKVVMLDDCDPSDGAWAAAGGCIRPEGDVTRTEFNGERFSPLSLAIIGHPSWRNDPGYLRIRPGEFVQVKNQGGRGHTFTKVEVFGGGVLAALNQGLAPAAECANATNVPPGAKDEVTGLTEGNHRFQCCFHPWMRTIVKVTPDD